MFGRKITRGRALLAFVLAVGWFLAASGVANAAEPGVLPGALNIKLIGSVDTADDGTPAKSRWYSKISPWPDTDGNYLYVGCYESNVNDGHVGCFRVVDVKDPAHPKRIATVEVFDRVNSPRPPPPNDPYWATHSATNVWTNPAFDNLPFSTACGDWILPNGPGWTTGPTCWDKGWITRTHYTAFASGEYSEPDGGPGCGLHKDKKILWVNSQRAGNAPAKRLGYTGVGFYDMKDPADPKKLSRIDLPVRRDPDGTYREAGGVHHGFFDGRYAYLGAEWAGYYGKILVIIDAIDPKNPVVVGTWHLPGQKFPEEDAIRDWTQQNSFSSFIAADPANPGRLFRHVGMHYISINHIHGKEIAFLSYHQAGLVILDVTDKSDPKFISRLDYLNPTFQASEPSPDYDVCNRPGQSGAYPKACGNAHSSKLVPDTNILWMTDEYFNPPYGHLRLIDVSNLKKPKIISHYLFPENLDTRPPDTPGLWPARTPSSHLGNAYNKNLLFLGWYGLGVRVFDISHPKTPKQVGYYSYSINDGVGGQGTYDVIFDQKGNLVVTDEGDGVRVLQYTGPGAPLR